jgi:hypothetical protein
MIPKKTAKALMRLVETYADHVAANYEQQEHGTGDDVVAAEIAMNKAKLELLIKLDSITEVG